jgi:putative ABC transport system permease protein
VFRLAFKNAKSHLGRFLLSIIAVALGTSFIIATFCFQTAINSTIDSAYASSLNADLFVRGDPEAQSSISVSQLSGITQNRQQIDVSLAEKICQLPDVQAAYPNINKSIVVVGKDDKPIYSLGTVMLRGIPENFLQFSGWTLESGQLPQADNEIVLEKQTAIQGNLSVGDTTKIVDDKDILDVRIAGILKAPLLAPGELLVGMNQSQAEKRYISDGKVSQIAVWGKFTGEKTSASVDNLRDEIKNILPDDSHAEVISGDQMRQELSQNVKDNIGFVNTFIIIFAIIALFVGCFIIANTFSMIVHESLREYAMLRAIGASSKQVFSTVIFQALVIGGFGSAIGTFLGTVLIQIIPIILKNFGTDINISALPNIWQILIVFAVGISISIISAIFPARKAGKTPPVQAMSEAALPKPIGVGRIIVGGYFFISSLFSIIIITNFDYFTNTLGLHSLKNYESFLASGAASGMILAALLLSPLFIKPVIWVLSSPLVLLSRVSGKLAKGNILRNFKSSANTSSALLIGVALVVCCSVLAASVQTSVSSIITNNIKSDFIILSQNLRMPKSVTDKVKQDNSLASVDPLYISQLKINSEAAPIISVEDTFFKNNLDLATFSYIGDPNEALEKGELIVPKYLATSQNFVLGQYITINGVDKDKVEKDKKIIEQNVKKSILEWTQKNLKQPDNSIIEQIKNDETKKVMPDLPVVEKQFKIGCIADIMVMPGIVINHKDFDAITMSEQQMLFRIFVNLKTGENSEIVKNELQNKVKDYYTISVLDKNGLNSILGSTINIVLNLIYGLLALSILIALLGIVNTLTLSVVQRTREIGLLKAIGLSNGGLTLMLGLESFLIAIFGTILGVVLGINGAVATQKGLKDSGLSDLTISYNNIAIFVGFVVIFSVIACLLPARRAKKLPILEAIAAD